MKLPVWRLATGSAILVALAAVLLMLAPIYVANFQLQRYLGQSLTARNSAVQTKAAPTQTTAVKTPAEADATAWEEEGFRRSVAGRARELALPVDSSQVTISHPGGGTRVEVKYAVRKDFGLYQVDLHFHPSAAR